MAAAFREALERSPEKASDISADQHRRLKKRDACGAKVECIDEMLWRPVEELPQFRWPTRTGRVSAGEQGRPVDHHRRLQVVGGGVHAGAAGRQASSVRPAKREGRARAPEEESTWPPPRSDEPQTVNPDPALCCGTQPNTHRVPRCFLFTVCASWRNSVGHFWSQERYLSVSGPWRDDAVYVTLLICTTGRSEKSMTVRD